MSSIESGILIGLATAGGFGTADFLAAKASRQFGAVYTAFWAQAIKVGLVATCFIALGWQLHITEVALLWAFLSGGITAIGLIAGFHALKLGPVGLASPFISGYALIAALLSLSFLHESLRPMQLIAVVLLVAGAMMASMNIQTHRPHKGFWMKPAVLFALTAALGIGTGLFFLALLVREVGWQSSTFLQSCMMLAVMGLGMVLSKQPLFSQKRQPLSWALIGAASFSFIATILINFGFSSSLVAIVAPVASISPLVTVGLALYFFRERLSAYQLVGAMVIIAALTLLAVR
ncbi:MAG TPA: DMT family transporter [Candidatus Saccharimonadia bacterium]